MAGVGRRISKRSAAATRARLEAKFDRRERWGGLSAGDVVKVRGERGARFVFRCHVLNRSNGATWVEVDELALPRRGAPAPADAPVAAGVPGDGHQVVVRRQRAFEEDRIVKVPRRRERRRAPQGVQGSFDLGV